VGIATGSSTAAIGRRSMRGADGEKLRPFVGSWAHTQESQITGMEASRATFEARLTAAQARWNFLRSQAVEVAACGEAPYGERDADPVGLSLAELLECIARCGVDKYAALLDTWLPTHGRKAMTRADAVRGMLQNVLGERDEEAVLREATIVRAERHDMYPKGTREYVLCRCEQRCEERCEQRWCEQLVSYLCIAA